MNLALPINSLRNIFKHHNVMVAYLFGSQAHGTAGPLSDIDLAIKFDPDLSVPEQKQTLKTLTHELSTLLQTDDLDVLDLESTHDPLLKHRAVFAGECLYALNPTMRFQLERSIMQQYEDTRHLRATQYRLMQQRLQTGTFASAIRTSPYVQKLLQQHVTS